MLTHLNIKNFAVVQSLSIDLHKGLSVITGETGAGKSIAVDALGLVLGDRADNGIIRDGTERAEISASFDISNNAQASQWLDEQGLENEECILRRVLSRDGRSRAFINGSSATLGQLREIGESLIDIHSQHEHQSLLNKASHRRLLDAFAGADKLAVTVFTTYQQWHQANTELAQLKADLQTQTEQYQLLRYQLEELDVLNLQPQELAQLEAEQQRLASAGDILDSGQQALALLEANDTGDNCTSLINQAIRVSENINDDHSELADCRELLQNAQIQIVEATSSLNHYLSQVNIDPQRQQVVEQRLSDIYQIARKHQIQPIEVPQAYEKIKADFEQMDGMDSRIEELAETVKNLHHEYLANASKLSKQRKAASKVFDQRIAEHLQTLGMEGCFFITELKPFDDNAASAHGLESIEFLVSTNPGQAPRQLNKVASGGELSRISLAIQVMSAQAASIPVLIFDEVDVGIGGGTAEVVGKMLRQLGTAGQVICVSHQPQVAAQAHQHLSVSKQTADGQTDSQMVVLEKTERVAEIARMLGGLKLTDQTLAHAQEMLDSAS
ncbi:MAG: DNA repair protein RecN [Pseudomonadales bacterium]